MSNYKPDEVVQDILSGVRHGGPGSPGYKGDGLEKSQKLEAIETVTRNFLKLVEKISGMRLRIGKNLLYRDIILPIYEVLNVYGLDLPKRDTWKDIWHKRKKKGLFTSL